MYRFIRMTSEGDVVSECYHTFITAYRRCIPDLQEDTHLRLAPATLEALETTDEPVLVSWNDAPSYDNPDKFLYTACWIQVVYSKSKLEFPALKMPASGYHH